ncbi:MAG: hypothetical protein ACI83I_002134 [Bacteroidia bacterium]|jgi:hypothetical protein
MIVYRNIVILFFVAWLGMLVPSEVYSQGKKEGLTQETATFKDVSNHFIKRYNTKLLTESSRIHFEKRVDGYYIRQVEYFPIPSTERYELLYSFTDHQYRELTIPAYKNLHEAEPTFSEPSRYDFLPLYGFEGWEEEVIVLPKSSLSELDLFMAKALAHASLAQNKYLQELDSFSKNDLKICRFHLTENVRLLREIKETNPSYIFENADITTHILTSDLIAAFVPTLFFHEDPSGNFEYEFSGFSASHAYNQLLCADSNALVLAFSNYDFLRLIGYQKKYRWREDVVLINTNWLTSIPYQNYVNASDTFPLLSPYSQDLVHQKIEFVRVLPYNRIRQDIRPGMSLAATPTRLIGIADNPRQVEDVDLAVPYAELEFILKFITQGNENQMDNGLTKYYYFPTNGIHLPTANSYIRWHIQQKLLSPNELIALDLINSSIAHRTISFLTASANPFYLGLEPHLTNNVFVQTLDIEQILNVPLPLHNDRYAALANLQKLMYGLKWNSVDEADAMEYYAYWHQFKTALISLERDDRFGVMLQVLDQYFKVFKPTTWQDVESILDFATYLYAFEEHEKAEIILCQLLNKLNADEFEKYDANKKKEMFQLIEDQTQLWSQKSWRELDCE